MIGFGVLQIFLSQIPNFHNLTYISTVAAITSFGYAFIGSGLSLAVVVSGIIFTNIYFSNTISKSGLHQSLFWRFPLHLNGVCLCEQVKENQPVYLETK